MVGARAVAACDLQVATVEEAVAGGDNAVFRYHLGGAAPHVVVGAGHAHAVVVLGEKDGAACHARAACSGLPRQSCLQRLATPELLAAAARRRGRSPIR